MLCSSREPEQNCNSGPRLNLAEYKGYDISV